MADDSLVQTKLNPHLKPLKILFLDDDSSSSFLRSIILRQHGFDCRTATSLDEAVGCFHDIDIAVLDHHLGAGKFGTDVAATLRQSRPEVPIIILSADPEYRFGGAADMHLLKGYSSNADLIAALRTLEAKRRGEPVVVNAREFFYSRITLAIGADVLIHILDATGDWVYCNEAAADFIGKERDWFPGRNLLAEMQGVMRDWRDVISSVATLRETYIDRGRRGLMANHSAGALVQAWSVLAFPITLHDGRGGVVLTARMLEDSLSPPG